jgi:hypothetical protein
MSGALSSTDVVPVTHARVKKFSGTKPHKTKSGKFVSLARAKILVKMNVKTAIMINGFNNDQRTPSDMFR